MAKKVLVTGVYGLIAGAVYRELQARSEYEVYALARRQVPSERAPQTSQLDIPPERLVLADLSDLAAVEKAVHGIDVVVQMAADPRPEASWESLLNSNIIGVRNVFEASVRAGVPRIVYASSIMVSWGYQLDEPYKSLSEGRFEELKGQEIHTVTHEWPHRPTGLYPATKIWGEALARVYADQYDLSCISVRLGNPRFDQGGDWDPDEIHGSLSPRDCAQLFACCVDADDVDFAIVNGVSNHRRSWLDIEASRWVPSSKA